MKDNICLLIIFFNPNREQIKQAKKLALNRKVIIVDNSKETLPDMDDVNLKYIPLNVNKGIAYAQNIGIKEAISQGFAYLLFQDQDSQLEDSQINALFLEYNSIKLKDEKIAAIGPVIINAENDKEYKNELGNKDTKIVSSIISSGMLVETSIFAAIGVMDDALFIDNIDHEWCWRASKLGYHIFMTRKAYLKHSIGINTKTVCGYQTIKSAPVRSYYKFRNNIILFKRNYVPIKWKIKTSLNMFICFFLYIIDSKDYGSKYLQNAWKGIVEGLNYSEI